MSFVLRKGPSGPAADEVSGTINVEEDGAFEGAVDTLNFDGLNVTVVGETATISGGGGSTINVEENGTPEGSVDTLNFEGLTVDVVGATASVSIVPAEFELILGSGGPETLIDFDLEAACPGIKSGDTVAIVLENDVIVDSIIPPPQSGFWCWFGVRNNLLSNAFTLKIIDVVSAVGTPANAFRTPGASAGDPPPGPVYFVNPSNTDPTLGSEEGWTSIGRTNDSGTWRVFAQRSVVNGSSSSAGSITKFDTTYSPVALYNFEYNLNDSSGNGLTLTGASTFRENWPGFVALISGVPARSSNDPILTIPGDITILSLLNMSAVPANGQVLNFSGNGGSENPADNFLYTLALPNQDTLQVFSESGGGVDAVFTSTGTSAVLPKLNVPFFVGARRQSNVWTFFVQKNQPFGSSSGVLATPTDGSAAFLKLRAGTNPPEIGSVAIYASALTDAQIKERYNTTIGAIAGFLA